MPPPVATYEALLRAWPLVRGQLSGQAQVSAQELRKTLDRFMLPVSEAVWVELLQALVKHQLLYPQGQDVFSFKSIVVPQPFRPTIESAWQMLWNTLKSHLIFPLGCLWSTQWLIGYFPECPLLLVLEVNSGELRSAAQLVRDASNYQPIQSNEAIPADRSRPTVLLRARQAGTPGHSVSGVRIASLEKVVVDSVTLFTPATEPLNPLVHSAIQRLQVQYNLDINALYKYAASHNQLARWELLLAAGKT